MSARDATRRVLERLRGEGFALAGVAPISTPIHADYFQSWLNAGRHGSMDYMSEYADVRLDPARLLEGARSVVMVADAYASRGDESEGGERLGRIARYGRGRDYHLVMKKRLHAVCDALRVEFKGSEFRSFVDSAPVLERDLAAAAGLGWIGKNTMMIHPQIGSYLLLGGFATTMELEVEAERHTDHCGTCTRCIDACPTRAIKPYEVDAQRCISYLTIEHRERIDASLHQAMGDWFLGCDVCQEVCPHNSMRPQGAVGPVVRPEYSPVRGAMDSLAVLSWQAADRRREFSVSSFKRATLAMMKRNALIVAGNSLRRRPDAGLRRRVEEVAGDEREPELVRETAREVLRALG